MNETEIIILLQEIRKEYEWVDTSDREIARMMRYLDDIPFEVAQANVVQHIKTNPKRAPKIAEIRGTWGEEQDHIRLKEQTAELLAQREQAEKNIKLPPPGQKEELYARLGITPRAAK